MKQETDELRKEMAVAAEAGAYTRPLFSSLVHFQPFLTEISPNPLVPLGTPPMPHKALTLN